MKSLLILLCSLLQGYGWAQNPPETGDPYTPRGAPTSPNGLYSWTVRMDAPIRYELVDLPLHKILVTVKAYYPESEPENIRYAKAYGVFWNQACNLVVLDELNRRRAGKIYCFSLIDGKVKQISLPTLLPHTGLRDEARLVVDPGWISPTKIRVRLSSRDQEGQVDRKSYVIDFIDPEKPIVEESNGE